jgi:16S rRNA processing protein RimM
VSAPAVVIGRIGRPHGIAGAVHSRGSGPTLPTIAVGEVLELRPREGAPRRLTVVARSGMPDQPILELEGVSSRDAAGELAGAEICVPAERVTGLDDPDTFFVRDLVGCQVLLGDRPLGPVDQVLSAPANDVLEVVREDGVVLVPFTADAVVELDVPGRRIVIRPDLFGPEAP